MQNVMTGLSSCVYYFCSLSEQLSLKHLIPIFWNQQWKFNQDVEYQNSMIQNHSDAMRETENTHCDTSLTTFFNCARWIFFSNPISNLGCKALS